MGPQESVDEKGRVMSTTQHTGYYPNLKTPVISATYYYEKHYGEEYSLKIIEAKKRVNLFDYFWPKFFEMVKDYEGELKLREFSIITAVPTTKPYLPITPTLFSLAERLSQHLNVPYEQVVKRIEFRKSFGRSLKDRYDANKDTMVIHCKSIAGKKVILVDDCRSSGMTILECTKILKAAGAEEVICLCLATHTSDAPNK